jgi:hypothetical protein
MELHDTQQYLRLASRFAHHLYTHWFVSVEELAFSISDVSLLRSSEKNIRPKCNGRRDIARIMPCLVVLQVWIAGGLEV